MSNDWIKHIRGTHETRKTKAWCGRKLSDHEFAFINIDQAANSQLNHDRLVPCKKCVKAIVNALQTQME